MLPVSLSPARPARQRWFAIVASTHCAITALALACPTAAQPLPLQDPDFSSAFSVSRQRTLPVAPVMRDAVHGWNYFLRQYSASVVDGVRFSQWLYRVSDAGFADGQWRLPDDLQIVDQYLAADGTPVVRAFVPGSGATVQRWYRLARESLGEIAPVPVADPADLPARTTVSRDPQLGGRPLWLPRGNGASYSIEPDPVAAGAAWVLYKRGGAGADWSRALRGTPNHLAVDAQNRVYLYGQGLAIGGKTGSLLRMAADGSIDDAWTPAPPADGSTEATLRVLADRVVVTGIRYATQGSFAIIGRYTSFDLISGATLSDRQASGRFGGVSDDGFVLSSHDDGRYALLDAKRNDATGDRVSTARIGVPANPGLITRWRDGYVVGGDFLLWHDGTLYRNLLRLDAALRPDPSWQPQPADAVGALAVDAQGRLLAATNSASGEQATLLRFAVDGVADASWRPLARGDVYALLPTRDGKLVVSGAFSQIDGVDRQSLARFAADDRVDSDWARTPTWPAMRPVRDGQFGRDGIYLLHDAGDQGLLFQWEDGAVSSTDSGIVRLSAQGTGAPLPLPAAIAQMSWFDTGGGSLLADPSGTFTYAITQSSAIVSGMNGSALVRLRNADFTLDPGWVLHSGSALPFTSIAYQSATELFVCQAQGGAERLRRVDKQTGTLDTEWTGDDSYRCASSFFEQRPDGGELISSWRTAGLALLLPGAQNEPRWVTEYYSRDAKRFFVTGRPNEIAQLDAMPASFRRTGMQFAATSARVQSLDTATAPVCRFYAAPATGGSNTHFYGRDSDCVVLKQFAALRYEGFDFRAGVPTAGGSCPASRPTAVYRLFNQQVSSNNGNHRYVVSEIRRNEMITAGWADEGIAFCTAGGIDSGTLDEIVR